MLFPPVKELNKTGELSLERPLYVTVEKAEGFGENIAENILGGIISSDGNIRLSYKKSDVPFGNEEEYEMSLIKNDVQLIVSVTAETEKGIARGLFTLKRMILKNEFVTGVIIDYPSFKVRGYIEGFYGKPWKSEQRKEMLKLLALFGENTHYYAPKDDPYHRNKWRELYPEKDALALKELLTVANEQYVDFYYCIAPGLSMRYTSDEDFEALKNKTKQLFNMGISNFGLLLDDIPHNLFYEEDKRVYGNAVNAHVELVGKYFDFLKSLSDKCRLTVCPTAYHGKGTEAELTDFASDISPEISVFFTGPDICSKELTVRDAEIFAENTKHKPLYWDNYPVNDAEMFMEMHIGPVIGREKELYNYSEGLISNCMEYFNCNKFPLITIASYLWAPESYDAEKAFSQAVEFLLPPEEREAFILLSDQFRTSCLHDENSRIMGEYLSDAAVNFFTGNFRDGVRVISGFAEKINNAVSVFRSNTSELYTELSRWIKKFYLMSDILNVSLECLNGADKKEEMRLMMEEYNESATVLTAFCFREYIESVLSDED